jgi:acetyl esterase/lipase
MVKLLRKLPEVEEQWVKVILTISLSLMNQSCQIDLSTGLINLSPDYRALQSTREVPGVWIAPVRGSLVVGNLAHWARRAGIEPIRIPGYWILQEGANIKHSSRPEHGEKVVLALHGGAYTRLSSHPSDPPGVIARSLVKHIHCVRRVFAPEYRLSSTQPFEEAHPFPTALLDALTAYVFLVNEIGFDPSDIIIEGDSAGGNLAYALTRYLVEYNGTPELPAPPGALLLLSPWADISYSHHHLANGSASKYITSDIIGDPSKSLKYATKAFTGPHGLEAAQNNPYISPASLDKSLVVNFKGFPRTFIVAGGAEVLLDQIRTLRDRMIKDLGEGNGVSDEDGMVRYYEAADGVHDYLVFPWHEPEFTDTYKAIAEWISLV